MRCSWCEPLLDEYVDGALAPAQAAAVGAHLERCSRCETLHRRVREVDALLETTPQRALHPDFTFDVMARVRTMEAPAPPKRPWLPWAAFYLVAAWIAAGLAWWIARPSAPLRFPAVAQAAERALIALSHGSAALWPVEPLALSVVAGILSIDVLLFAAVIVFYRRVRPRLTAYLAAGLR